MLNKIAYGYPAELIGEVEIDFAGLEHNRMPFLVPVQYKAHINGELVFDIRIGKFVAKGVDRYGRAGESYGDLPLTNIYLDDVYKEIYVDIVRKTAKKYDIKLSSNDPNRIRSEYHFTENGTILGPGFTEVGGPARCKTCGDLNEYVSSFRDYECKKCKMMKDWAKSAGGNKSQKLLALANTYSYLVLAVTFRKG